jgi:hypothetical protein
MTLSRSAAVSCDSSAERTVNKKPPNSATQINAAMSRITLFRMLLALSLVITGVAGGMLSYYFLRQKETIKFKTEFDAFVYEVFTSVDEGLQSKLTTLEHVSTMLAYQCPHTEHWPNCSAPLKFFQDLTATLLDVSASRAIDYNPIVRLHEKDGFEAFAYDLFEREGFPPGTGISSFGKGIFALYEDGTRHPDDGRTNFSDYDLFIPVFQPADIARNWQGVMYNMHSEINRANAIDAVIDCATTNKEMQREGLSIVQGCAAVTDIIQLVSEDELSPASIIFTPIFPVNDNTTLAGINSIIFTWATILGSAATNRGKLDCVVETCVDGVIVSRGLYELQSGIATYINNDPDTDDRYDLHGLMATRQLSFGPELATSATYKLHFHTTDDFYNQHYTQVPILGSVVCVTIIIIICSLFFVYDKLVKRESVENKMLLDSKRLFVRFISHEIRTPINTVTLGLQLLAAQLSELAPASDETDNPLSDSAELQQQAEGGGSAPTDSGSREAIPMLKNEMNNKPLLYITVQECLDLVDELMESSQTAVVVLNDFLNYDKIELKKFHVERHVLDIFKVLEDTARPHELLAKQKQLQLTIMESNYAGEKAFVIGDAVKLGQVIR